MDSDTAAPVEEDQQQQQQQQQPFLRPVYLIVQRQPLFKAHWSLFVPSTRDNEVGTKIHATGDALNGFAVAFDRGFELETASPSQSTTLLGAINAAYVDDARAAEDSSGGSDSVARDRLEAYAAAVPAPGPSLRSSSSNAVKVVLVPQDAQRHCIAKRHTNTGTQKRVEIKDCQTWLRDFVSKLVEEGVLGPESLDVLDSAPKH